MSHHPRTRIAMWLAVLTALAVSLSACAPSQQSEGGQVVLDVGVTGEPTGLDPSTVAGAPIPFVLLYNVYETLIKIDGDGKIQPSLATDWTISPDRMTYTFELDPQARFADGTPLTAESVKTSFERARDAEGIRDQIRSQMSVVAVVEAPAEHTVSVTLSRPSNMWLYDMTGPAGIVYNPASLDNLNEQPAGSGPYMFAEWDHGTFIQVDRNQDYWGDPPQVDEIFFRFYADPNAMNTAMLSGQLDVISNLTVPQSIGQFVDASRFTVLEGTTDGEVVLGFNHTNKALADVKVRRAINYAIDRQALVDATWGGKGQLIGSMVAPTDPWFEDLSATYPFDPQRARDLLKDAGYESGLTLRLRIPTLPYAPPAARFIAAQLAEVGITAEVEELEWARWLELVYGDGDYDMTIVAHVEPRDIVDFANPDSYWRYDNPEFATLLAEADIGTPEEQTKKLREGARILADDAAADWLFLLPNIIITTSNITGISTNATGLSFDLSHVKVQQ